MFTNEVQKFKRQKPVLKTFNASPVLKSIELLDFDYLEKITKNQHFLDQIAHILVFDKARIAHESSLKSSVFAFSGGLTSFQNFMIFTPCNSSI